MPCASMPLDGALIVDKPPGLTSHDVVAAVRRALGASRVGHTGTLDPMATGVLPLLLGRATRLARFLAAATKQYEARVRFGWATDTYDATGRRLAPPAAAAPERPDVERALQRFRGTFPQQPPAFSARKVQGARAYALARGSEAPRLAPSSVTVDALELIAVEGSEVLLRVTCSAGFYVRTLAHDLGETLGVGAHLSALRRTASGAFGLADASPLDAILAGAATARERVVRMEDLLADWPAVQLNEEGLRRVRHGADPRRDGVAAGADRAAGWVRLLAPDGTLAALAVSDETPPVLRPAVVLM